MEIGLDNDGDLAFVGGDLVPIHEQDEIAQNLLIRLRFFQGEWFLDTRIGLPFYEKILIKGVDENVVRALFRQAIITTPGVEELVNFDYTLDRERRAVTISFEARTTDGEILNFNRDFVIL